MCWSKWEELDKKLPHWYNSNTVPLQDRDVPDCIIVKMWVWLLMSMWLARRCEVA